METVKHIKIKDYNYPLTDVRIAKYPLSEREHSKLLIYDKGEIKEDVFYNIAEYLPKNALMIRDGFRLFDNPVPVLFRQRGNQVVTHTFLCCTHTCQKRKHAGDENSLHILLRKNWREE